MDKAEILQVQKKDLRKHDLENTRWSAFVDFSRPANQHRFFLINNDDMEITYSWYTSHGSGSGPIERCEKVSNVNMSRCSSAGACKTGSLYQGKYGWSLKLKGLIPGMNDNVERRSIVMHRAPYVSQSHLDAHDFPGRSWGCITLDPKKADEIMNYLVNGSLVNVYFPGA